MTISTVKRKTVQRRPSHKEEKSFRYSIWSISFPTISSTYCHKLLVSLLLESFCTCFGFLSHHLISLSHCNKASLPFKFEKVATQEGQSRNRKSTINLDLISFTSDVSSSLVLGFAFPRSLFFSTDSEAWFVDSPSFGQLLFITRHGSSKMKATSDEDGIQSGLLFLLQRAVSPRPLNLLNNSDQKLSYHSTCSRALNTPSRSLQASRLIQEFEISSTSTSHFQSRSIQSIAGFKSPALRTRVHTLQLSD